MVTRVAHYATDLGFAGTQRTAQLFCQYLLADPDYEPYLLYDVDGDVSRQEEILKWLPSSQLVPITRKFYKPPNRIPYSPDESNITEVLRQIDPHIVHVHRSGYHEWPGIRGLYLHAKFVETNIFGYIDPTHHMDASFFVSNFIMHRWKQDPHWYAAHPNAVKRHKAVLPNPIRTPLVNTKKYRDGLPDDAIVLGRVGRADYFDPIALEAFAKIERSHANVYYFVVNPCDQWKATVQDLGIKNVHFFSPIKNDVELSEFYNSIDIFAHARADGETFGCAIAEAMMHGVPVVTHEGSVYQAQKDTIADAGFCVKRSDVSAYHHVLHELVTNGALRKNLGDRARQHAEEHYEARRVVSQLKQHYERVLHGLE